MNDYRAVLNDPNLLGSCVRPNERMFEELAHLNNDEPVAVIGFLL